MFIILIYNIVIYEKINIYLICYLIKTHFIKSTKNITLIYHKQRLTTMLHICDYCPRAFRKSQFGLYTLKF